MYMAVPVHRLFASGTQKKFRLKTKELGTFIVMGHCEPSMKPVDSSPGKRKRSVRMLSNLYGEGHTEQAA